MYRKPENYSMTYSAIHQWVRYTWGKPDECEHCDKVEGNFHWASKTNNYTRNRNDWMRLCSSCHKYHDLPEGWEPINKGQLTLHEKTCLKCNKNFKHFRNRVIYCSVSCARSVNASKPRKVYA